MRWLGQMQRAFDLMCSYSLEREAFGSPLADKQTVQNWIADSAAYFAGRALGRRKLAPRTSPGKTWEGAVGGLLGVEVYVIICALTIPAIATRLEEGEGWFLYLAGSAVLCIVSIIGDLFESAVKRQASVKDSGTLLPGHGGVLDRIDSAVAALPVAALMVIFLVTP